MAERRPFLLRVDPALLDALQKWAADDLRSLNAQIDFLLRRALQQAGRLRPKDPAVLGGAPPMGEPRAADPLASDPPDARGTDGEGG